MPMDFQKAPKTNVQYIACERCKGFGYELSPNKEHIPCPRCHDLPSMYAVFEQQPLFWGVPISDAGIAHRAAQRVIKNAFNVLLMAAGVLGVFALGYSAYQYFYPDLPTFIDIILFFTTADPFLAFFWISVALDLLLYYRLDRESHSKKQFDYSLEAQEKAKKQKEQFKMPANPTWEKFHRMSHTIDIAAYCTQDVLQSIDQSYQLAQKLDHHQITPLHLLGALLENNSVITIMVRLGLSKNLLLEKIGKAMAKEGIDSGRGLDLGLESKQMFFYAYEKAITQKRRTIDTMELFVAIVEHDPWVSQIIYDLEIDQHTLENVVEWIHLRRRLVTQYSEWAQKAAKKPKGIMDRAMTARPSPVLQALSQDYTGIAARGGFFPAVGRANEMEQVMRILLQRTGNILLVGPSGVGKSTILQGIAERMASEDVPKKWQDKRFVVLDPGALVANAEGIGAIEGRMLEIVREINQAGNILLGIEDVHHLLNMRSTSGSEDAGSILMNSLSEGHLQVVATTTTEEYQEYIARRATFLRRFQVVKMDEMSVDDAILVLEARSAELEAKHTVFFSYAAIKAAVELSVQFIQDRYLPAKALDIISEAAPYVQGKKGNNSMVTREDIAEVVAEKTNVQVTSITEDERDKLLNLESIMHQRVVGQDEAVQAIASALRRAREGLRDKHRPIANLLFLGPTGVGKTETAKTIAEVYFGNEENMIRLDMSEYQDVDALQKMIGGKGEPGILTEAVKLHPFALVLLDEFEKAHPDLLNVFLQVMDDGRLTDGLGRTVDLSNTMIIATSNAATQQIQNGIAAGVPPEQMKTQLMEEVLPQIFRPELLNRFDNVVLFKPLTFEEVQEIANRVIASMKKRIGEERGIELEITPAAVEEVAKLGYDPLYGARPLRRAIQDTIDDALAKLFLSGQVMRRDKVILDAGGQTRVEHADRL